MKDHIIVTRTLILMEMAYTSIKNYLYIARNKKCLGNTLVFFSVHWSVKLSVSKLHFLLFILYPIPLFINTMLLNPYRYGQSEFSFPNSFCSLFFPSSLSSSSFHFLLMLFSCCTFSPCLSSLSSSPTPDEIMCGIFSDSKNFKILLQYVTH